MCYLCNPTGKVVGEKRERSQAGPGGGGKVEK